MRDRPLAVIVPNLHWRYTGVTATNRMVAPRLAKLMPTAWLGGDAPPGMPRLGLRGLLRLRGRSRPLVWHARRNNEMLAGLALKYAGWPLRLVFTSVAPRDHSGLTRALIARMDAVIVTSASAQIGRSAVFIPHGVDTERFAPPADRRAAFNGGHLPGRYAIGCFGRVRPQKGTDVFVEAMCRLLPAHPDFSAVIIGAETPDQRTFAEALKARVRKGGLSERIQFKGELPVDALPDWFGRLTIYAFTSRIEGFGLTLLEAMASGVAVVAARAGAAETLVEEGKTGVLVPPGDVDALVAALKPLMRDPAAALAMGREARACVAERFGVQTEAERIAEVHRSLLDETTVPVHLSS